MLVPQCDPVAGPTLPIEVESLEYGSGLEPARIDAPTRVAGLCERLPRQASSPHHQVMWFRVVNQRGKERSRGWVARSRGHKAASDLVTSVTLRLSPMTMPEARCTHSGWFPFG